MAMREMGESCNRPNPGSASELSWSSSHFCPVNFFPTFATLLLPSACSASYDLFKSVSQHWVHRQLDFDISLTESGVAGGLKRQQSSLLNK